MKVYLIEFSFQDWTHNGFIEEFEATHSVHLTLEGAKKRVEHQNHDVTEWRESTFVDNRIWETNYLLQGMYFRIVEIEAKE